MFLFQLVTPAYGPYRLRKPSGPTPVMGWARNIANAAFHSLPLSTASVLVNSAALIGGGILACLGAGCAVVDVEATATSCRVGSLPMPLFEENHITFSCTKSHSR